MYGIVSVETRCYSCCTEPDVTFLHRVIVLLIPGVFLKGSSNLQKNICFCPTPAVMVVTERQLWQNTALSSDTVSYCQKQNYTHNYQLSWLSKKHILSQSLELINISGPFLLGIGWLPVHPNCQRQRANFPTSVK